MPKLGKASEPSRRRFIKVSGGAVGLTGLAGCLGGNGGGDGDGSGDGDDGGGDDTGDGQSPEPETEEEWPADGDTFRIIVPYSPGGGYDWFARNIGAHLPEYMPADVEVVVENVEGAGGLVATNQVWGEEPDGHTFMIRHGLNSVTLQIGRPQDVEYDVAEFVDLASPAVSLYGIVQRAGSDPIESWDDLVSVATEWTWGGIGPGVTTTIWPQFLGMMNDAWSPDDMNYVHFDGIGEAMPSMDRGEIDLYAPGIGSGIPYIEDGICEPVVAFSNPGEAAWEDGDRLVDWDMPDAEGPTNAFRAPRIFSAPPETPEWKADILGEALYETMQDDEYVNAGEEAGRLLAPSDRETTMEMSQNMIETWSEWDDELAEVMD